MKGPDEGTERLVRGVTDEELIGLIARRDELALRELYRRYVPYLKAMARRMIRDGDEVEQCLQDTFVRVWEAAERFDAEKSSAKTWIVTIGHRLMINRLRKERPQTVELDDPDRLLAASSTPDHVQRIYLSDALASLDGEDRQLLELAFFQGHTHQELSELTGRPLGTVKTTIRRALLTLRKAMAGGVSDD